MDKIELLNAVREAGCLVPTIGMIITPRRQNFDNKKMQAIVDEVFKHGKWTDEADSMWNAFSWDEHGDYRYYVRLLEMVGSNYVILQLGQDGELDISRISADGEKLLSGGGAWYNFSGFDVVELSTEKRFAAICAYNERDEEEEEEEETYDEETQDDLNENLLYDSDSDEDEDEDEDEDDDSDLLDDEDSDLLDEDEDEDENENDKDGEDDADSRRVL